MDPAAVPPRAPQVLQVLPCLNEAGLKPWDCGLWDETTMPSTLTGIIRSPERHLQAIQHINKIHQKKVWFRSECAQGMLTISVVIAAVMGTVEMIIHFKTATNFLGRILIIVGLLGLYKLIFTYRKQLCDRIMYLLKKAVGGANSLLCDDNILIGCQTNAALVFVYVPLDACRDDLGTRFDSAVLKHSCAYALGLAQGQLPYKSCCDSPSHLQGACCFCQFVRRHKCCCCWC